MAGRQSRTASVLTTGSRAMRSSALIRRFSRSDAAELVSVNYEALPAIVDVANAMRPDPPLVHDDITGNVSFTMSIEDAAATAQAFAHARHVRSGQLCRTLGGQHCCGPLSWM